MQFVDLLAKVAEALKDAGVLAAQLVGTPTKRSQIIESFQVWNSLPPSLYSPGVGLPSPTPPFPQV